MKKANLKYLQSDMPYSPKFSIGDRVRHPKDLYGAKSGKIVELVRCYLEVDDNGNFKSDGLLTTENTIASTCLPYSFDGMTLTVKFPRTDFGTWIQKAYTHTSKFYGYCYVVKCPKLRTEYHERSLRPYGTISNCR
mgnify:CR=1 FL=1